MYVECKFAGSNPARGESFRMRATGGRVLPNDGTLFFPIDGDGSRGCPRIVHVRECRRQAARAALVFSIVRPSPRNTPGGGMRSLEAEHLNVLDSVRCL